MTPGIAFVAFAAALTGVAANAQPQTDARSTKGLDKLVGEALTGLRWRNIGPNVGGRSIAVAGSAKRPLEYYFGAAGGGLWKTTNAGTDWTPVTDGQITSASVGAVAVCEANPDVVYIGTGETQLRGAMSMGDGVYGSRDAGKTWTHLGLGSSTGQQAIARVRIDPTDCYRVYVAVLGDPWGPNPERGVFRSTDGGKTWERVLYRDDKSGGVDLSVDPQDARVLYASLWQVRRRPWEANSGGPGSGIFKSADGGSTWSELTHNPGLPVGRIGKIGIAASGAQRNLVYALIEHEDGGLYRSDDGGATWRRMNGSRALYGRAEYYTRVFADPQEANTIYIPGQIALFRSRDGGRTYQKIAVPHGDNQDMWIDPTNNRRLIESNDGGANVSWDCGATWTAQDYPTAQMYHVITTNDYPYHVCGAQQDNSSKCVPSDGDGSYYYTTAAGEQGYIAIDPRNSDLSFGGSEWGRLAMLDRKTGQRHQIDVWPDFALGHPPSGPERFQWTFPIVLSPQDPSVVYAASQRVWRTRDRGHRWDAISPDLTYADPTTLEGEKSIVRQQNSQDYYATIFSLAPSPRELGVIWAGSDDGLVHVTRDGGAHWQKVTPPDVPKFSRVTRIEASRHTPGTAYVAIERYKMQDLNPYLYRTSDYGRTWTKIVTGFAPGHYLRAMKEDIRRPGLLFAGTEHGAYVSINDGASWQPIALPLPDVQVSDLEVNGNDLVIATYGRGFYVLDNALTVLRQLKDDVATAPVHLFEPADAVRSLAGTVEQYRRIRRGNEVDIVYRLAVPAQDVRIELLDAHRAVIRTFSSLRSARTPERVINDVGAWINGPDAGFPVPDPPIGTAAGIHRLVWDMRYPPAAGFPGMFLVQASLVGPFAAPGEYRVRLTVDGGAPHERSFNIVMDPRLKDVTPADLREQFTLAMQIHKRFSEGMVGVASIRALRNEIDARLREAGPRVAVNGERLKSRLAHIEEKLYLVQANNAGSGAQYGIRIVERLSHLLHHDVLSADARPTRQMYQVFDRVSRDLQTQLDALAAVKRTDVPQFLQQVERARPH